MLNWCLFSRSELEKLLATDFEKGLTSSAVLLRSANTDTAKNELKEFLYPLLVFFRSLWGMLCDFSVLMLLLAVLLSELILSKGFAGTAIMIGFIIICSLIRASLAMFAKFSDPESGAADDFKVLRDGKIKLVRGDALVRGDVILLSKGDIAPCDLRLVDSENLTVIEKYDGKRMYTVSKDAMYYPLKMEHIPPRMRKNMVYCGSAVISGNALAVVPDEKMPLSAARRVVNIEPENEEFYIEKSRKNPLFDGFVKNNSSLADGMFYPGFAEKKSFLKSVGRIVSFMRVCCLCAGTMIFVISLFAGMALADSFVTSVAVISCAPYVLCEISMACAFVAGGMRLKQQNSHIRNPECAQKLVLSKSVLCCGATCFSVERMIAEACYIGRSLDITKENANKIQRFCEMLLCTSNLYYRTDKNGTRTISGDAEGLAALEAARRTEIVPKGSEKHFIERLSEFHDINGTLFGSFCLYRGKTMLITKGSVAAVLSRCSHYDINSTAEVLEPNMRERIRENAKAYENNESCHVVAVCYKPCDYVSKDDFNGGFVFAGFVVFGTRLNYGSAKYVDILRRNGITPVIFSNVASDMVIGDAKKIGVLTGRDNYLTAKSFESLDEKIFSDDLNSYTLYMGLTPKQKRSVVMNKKYGEGVISVTADKPGDAFDMSEADVLISFGKGAPKTLRRVSDIHSGNNGGIGLIYRTICICRNMMRCMSLASGYLVASQIASVVFCFFGAICSFFTGGAAVMKTPQLICAFLVTDFVISLLTALIKTPSSIISDSPESFNSYYEPENIFKKAAISGALCGFSGFVAYLVGILISGGNIAAGAACAFLSLFLSKGLVSLFCIMTTSTENAPAGFPKGAAIAELALGAIFAAAFGSSFIPLGYGKPILLLICAIASVIPAIFTKLFIRLYKKK